MLPQGGLRRVLETCLYVADLERSRKFYEDVFALEPHFADERMAAYRIGDTMLLLFVKGGTLEPVETPGGVIPPHDGHGPMHFAFSIENGSEQSWLAYLRERDVDIEGTVDWPRWRSVSIYFRDPDGHLVELATAGLWGID